MKRPTGLCPSCGSRVTLNKDGCMRAHGYRIDLTACSGDHCAGSGALPAPKVEDRRDGLITFQVTLAVAVHPALVESLDMWDWPKIVGEPTTLVHLEEVPTIT